MQIRGLAVFLSGCAEVLTTRADKAEDQSGAEVFGRREQRETISSGYQGE
jgi:hypothetical protein